MSEKFVWATQSGLGRRFSFLPLGKFQGWMLAAASLLFSSASSKMFLLVCLQLISLFTLKVGLQNVLMCGLCKDFFKHFVHVAKIVGQGVTLGTCQKNLEVFIFFK